MPQTGNRKLLLNDVKYKRLFPGEAKVKIFCFPMHVDPVRSI